LCHVDQDNPTRISKEFLSDDPCNVHVLWENTIQFWVRELKDAGLTESHIRADLEESARDYRQRKEAALGEIREMWKKKASGEEVPSPSPVEKKERGDWEYE
jgi:hypothetical protein